MAGRVAAATRRPVDYRQRVSGLAGLRRHRETIGLWLLALVFAMACVFLGRWQLHRYQAKHEAASLVARNYDAAPVPLSALLPTAASRFDRALQWRQVRVSGRYDAPATVVVRNRPHTGQGADAVFGYEVVVPLRLADGSALLVDRGWVPSGSNGDRPGQAPDSVPAPPGGRVEVIVRLKAGEGTLGRRLPPGQVASVAVPTIAAGLGYPVYAAYGVVADEAPTTTPAPAPLDPPVVDGGEGINASYAVQWVLFAVLGLAFPVWVARRRREAAGLGADPSAPSPTAAPDDPSSAVKGAGVRGGLVSTRTRRHRIWDDEDE